MSLRMIWPGWTRAATLTCALVAAVPAHAATRALVVGVGDYPQLEKRLWLKGPANDAELMATVLRGSAGASDVQLLSDRTPQSLPTRANILAALDRLETQAARGDTVVLYFAGHGSQQPARPGDSGEPDGLDEIFLPRDAENWDNSIGSVRNAIIDNEISRYVDRLRAKGAMVVALFDSCHSETMTRGPGAPEVTFRSAPAAVLGIPDAAATLARAADARAELADDDRSVLDDVPESSRGGFVAMYAAQTYELAPEMRLPLRSPEAVPQGLFTYTLAQVLSRGGDITWRQVRDEVIARYRSEALWSPTPQMSGTALDQVVFRDTQGQRRDNWLLSRRAGAMEINAGRLDQLEPGDVLAVLRSPLDGIEKAIAQVKVDRVTLTSATVTLVPGADGAIPDTSQWPSRPAVARAATPVRLEMRVALPSGPWPFKEVGDASLQAALATLRDQLAGTSLVFVSDGDADLRLVADYVELDGKDAASAAKPRQVPALFFAPRTGKVITRGPQQTHALMLVDPADNQPRTAPMLAEALEQSLSRIARTVRLQRLGSGLGDQASALGLELKLQVASAPPSGQAARFVPATSLQKVRVGGGDLLRLDMRNNGRSPIDITVLYIDSDYGITPIYPYHADEQARLKPGEAKTIDDLEITDTTIGEEQLVIIALPGAGDVPRDYLAFAQPALMRTRGHTDRGNGSALDLLLADVQEPITTRGAPSRAAVGAGEKAVIQTLRLNIGKRAQP